jgi:hypothetical protein
MKTREFNKKLVLNKKTVVNLNQEDLQSIKGGYEKTTLYWCVSRNYCSELPRICETRLFCSVPYCETDPVICF